MIELCFWSAALALQEDRESGTDGRFAIRPSLLLPIVFGPTSLLPGRDRTLPGRETRRSSKTQGTIAKDFKYRPGGELDELDRHPEPPVPLRVVLLFLPTPRHEGAPFSSR